MEKGERELDEQQLEEVDGGIEGLMFGELPACECTNCGHKQIMPYPRMNVGDIARCPSCGMRAFRCVRIEKVKQGIPYGR